MLCLWYQVVCYILQLGSGSLVDLRADNTATRLYGVAVQEERSSNPEYGLRRIRTPGLVG